jgi:hypothetical protein
MDKLVETSQVHRKNVIVIGLAAALFAGMAILTLYSWVKWHRLNLFELFVELMFIFVLIERAGGKYTYEVDKKALRITKKSIFGRLQTFEIPYRDIFGIYRYKAKLIGVLKFRRTYRLQSALDNRPVWTLAYTAAGRKGKTENRRIYFKPSEAMLDALAEKIPGKVKISEEEAVISQVAKEK